MSAAARLVISDELQQRIDAAFAADDTDALFALLNEAPVEPVDELQFDTTGAVQVCQHISKKIETM